MTAECLHMRSVAGITEQLATIRNKNLLPIGITNKHPHSEIVFDIP